MRSRKRKSLLFFFFLFCCLDRESDPKAEAVAKILIDLELITFLPKLINKYNDEVFYLYRDNNTIKFELLRLNRNNYYSQFLLFLVIEYFSKGRKFRGNP